MEGTKKSNRLEGIFPDTIINGVLIPRTEQNCMPLDRPPPFFVGNHLALDFLNTIATPQGAVIDWLRDGQDLVRWLADARVIDRVIAARSRTWRRDSLDEAAKKATEFRN